MWINLIHTSIAFLANCGSNNTNQNEETDELCLGPNGEAAEWERACVALLLCASYSVTFSAKSVHFPFTRLLLSQNILAADKRPTWCKSIFCVCVCCESCLLQLDACVCCSNQRATLFCVFFVFSIALHSRCLRRRRQPRFSL